VNVTVRSILLALATVLVTAGSASAQIGTYTSCEGAGTATIVEISGATCDVARAVATATAAATPATIEQALQAAGWMPLQVEPAPGSDTYDVSAIRGLAAMRLRLPGAVPDLGGWTADRELLFSRRTLVGGAKPPSDSTVCTSAFLVKLGAHVGGLTAAHCSGLTKTGKTARRNTALRRPPQPGIVLGTVQRNLARRARPIDVMVLPVPSGPGRPSADVIDRFVYQPPWFVRGTARPLLGRRVCFSGRTSGPDNCGRIVHRFLGVGRLVCTDITAREGDSGSPVYTEPGAAGTVRAVGIANIVFGIFQSMCFEPIAPVLDALDAKLVSAGG
jgi:hypothetical protein